MNCFSTIGVTLGVLAYYDMGAGWGWAAAFVVIGVLLRAAFQDAK